MVTIDVNSITIEGTDLKEATRLAKKEEKRQEKAKAIAQQNSSLAYTLAWASYGKVARRIAQGHHLSFYDASNGSHRSFKGQYERVWIDQRNYGDAYVGSWELLGYECLGLLCDAGGWILGVRLSSKENPTSDVCWYAVGAYQGEVASLDFPESSFELIELAFQAYLNNSQKQAARSRELRQGGTHETDNL